MRNELNLHLGPELIGTCAITQHVTEQIERAGRHNANVVLYGETGSGKEVAARRIHNLWSTNQGGAVRPFVAINCGAIPTELFESEMFGHERGAFTGAVATKKGRLELAHGGTVFLDEIAELRSDHQVKILRVLEDKMITRVGGTEEISVQFRIIAGTNADLRKRVREKKFREDLYYRLDVVPIVIPPLRKRSDDIPTLAEIFYVRYSSLNNPGVQLPLSDEVLQKLNAYQWPGNIRELFNILERAALNGRNEANGNVVLSPDDFDFPEELDEPFQNEDHHEGHIAALVQFALRMRGVVNKQEWEAVKTEYARRLLDRNGGHRSKTAKQFGMSRPSFYKMLELPSKDAPEYQI